jgi:RHS repeat-associated protein
MGYSTNRLQLTSLSYVKNSTTLFGLSYGYTQNQSNNGQITNITDSVDNGRSISYTLDPLSRISSATTVGSTNFPKWGLSWIYDRYGNRPTQSVSAGCTGGFSCPAPSVSIDPATNHITGTGFTYDANGNMTADGGINNSTYDAANLQIGISNSYAGTSSYVYDGNGLRVEKTTGGATMVYIFSGGIVIAEYALNASANSPSKEYVHSGSKLIATIDTATKYHLSDHLSVRVTTDSGGNILGQQGHFPFGESWYVENPMNKSFFTSYERDAESGSGAAGSGNDYALARNYSSRFGRFNSADPLPGDIGDPQSLDRYSYVRNMPIVFIDPTGLCPGGTARDYGPYKWQDRASRGPYTPGEEDPLDTPPPSCTGFTGQGTNCMFTLDGIPCSDFEDGGEGLLGDGESSVQCPNNICSAKVCLVDVQRNKLDCFYLTINGANGPYYTDKNGHELFGQTLAEWVFTGLPDPAYFVSSMYLSNPLAFWKPVPPSSGNGAGGGANSTDANANGLAQALDKTKVQSLDNPCTPALTLGAAGSLAIDESRAVTVPLTVLGWTGWIDRLKAWAWGKVQGVCEPLQGTQLPNEI